MKRTLSFIFLSFLAVTALRAGEEQTPIIDETTPLAPLADIQITTETTPDPTIFSSVEDSAETNPFVSSDIAEETTISATELVTETADATPVVADVAPVIEQVAMTPVPDVVNVTSVVNVIPTEEDIAKISTVLTSYKVLANALAKIRDAATIETVPLVCDDALVKSILNLLSIYKKQATAINQLRDSIVSLKAMLTAWEQDVESLIKLKKLFEQKKTNQQNKKEKKQRTVDYTIIKDQASKPKPQR